MKEKTSPEPAGKNWHCLSAAEALALQGSDASHGLDEVEAGRRQARFGANSITPARRTPPWLRLLLQFHQPLIYILTISAAITALLQEWVDASVIFGVVLVNAIIGYLQESKAENAIAALSRIVTTRSTVVRGGRKRVISSLELVPGDIVQLAAGDKVPADLRLFACRELRLDESMITGESLPVAKRSAALEVDTDLADRANMAYAGSLVSSGGGGGVVVAIGDATETGRISRLMQAAIPLSTPLTRKIEWFSKVLLYVILALAAFTFAIGTWRGETAFDMFMAAVALSVGAIPEGLPAAVTVTLAIGVARMASRRAIIRKLTAVETLGSTTVICSDKTGTLTQNQMTVQSIYAGQAGYTLSGSGYSPQGQILREGQPIRPHGALRACLLAGALCNDAVLEMKEGLWRIGGDPTEGALLVSALKGGVDAAEQHAVCRRLDSLPFESRHQYMASLHDCGGVAQMYVKGALERILERCDAMLDIDGKVVGLDAGRIEAEAAVMAGQGLRVLALASKRWEYGEEALDHKHAADALVFLGLQGMIDPPRPEAVAAVAACRRAGIAVKMITGDHAATATAIARLIGMGDGEIRAISGRELAELDDRALRQAARETTVFARMAPEQKLRLVEALQAEGEVVAMTGDGVNDAPALKRADIGVAMGLSGTEVAKEAADMVLLDDNFASIEAAVEEGRGVFDNLTKFIAWTLPTNFGEGFVITAAIVSGVALPILPVQILWINMTTAVLLGLMLAFEPIEPGIMQRQPRSPQTPILTMALMLRIALVSLLLLAGSFGLFLWELNRGAELNAARTVAANVFVMGELFYLFNCRSMTESMFRIGVFSNLWVVGGVALTILLQGLFTYLPAMNRWFQTAPIGYGEWLRILAVGLLIYLAVGGEKSLRRYFLRRGG
ncbi:MAG: cation-transporting P-type ATPase [Burkholderiales bacterium]